MGNKRANGEGNIRSAGQTLGGTAHRRIQPGRQTDHQERAGKTQAEVKSKLSVAIAVSHQQLDVSRSGEYTVAEWLRLSVRTVCQAQHPAIRQGCHPARHRAVHRSHREPPSSISSPAGRSRSCTRTCWRMGGCGKNRKRNRVLRVHRAGRHTSCSQRLGPGGGRSGC